MKVLGLDISTSCTGLAIVNVDNDGVITPIDIGHIDTSKCKSIWEKIDHFESVLEFYKFVNTEPDKVYVEQALMSFRTGSSNANTITKLVMFNALVSNLFRVRLGITPVHIAPQTARKSCGIKVSTGVGVSAKQQSFEHVTKIMLPRLNVDVTRTGKPKSYMYDRVDAYVIAHAGATIEYRRG